jgi:acetoin utilization deacetylase AcuC-like enzyme
MISVFYSPAYVGSGHAFDTTRKAKWVADSLAQSPISGIQLLEPRPLTRDQVMQVHAADYIQAVETGTPRARAESQGFPWDSQLWPMVLASNGGTVAAALDALEHKVAGSLSSGLHHARREHGAGFCTFNGLVIAAREVLAAGAQAVLILDLDAHCGGGTQSLIEAEPKIWQSDVSVDRYDFYSSSERCRLDLVQKAETYLSTIQRVLERIAKQTFDLCLYNAGMDPFEGCSTGGLSGITQDILAQRETLVFDWCRSQNLPVAFVLAGGYVGSQLEKAQLVELHRLTLSAAAELAKH